MHGILPTCMWEEVWLPQGNMHVFITEKQEGVA